MTGLPPLEAVAAERVLAAVAARRAGYVPEWQPEAGDPAAAVAEVMAHFAAGLSERVAGAADKHLAAMLDMAGVNVLPPQAAAAALVFAPLPGAPPARVEARTRIGAAVEGRDEPVPFETDTGVAVTSSPLVEVRAVLPGSDAVADHGPGLTAGTPTRLFSGARRTPRALYLGDPLRLAFNGRSEVELDVEVVKGAAPALPLEWSWWDGSRWRAFTELVDPEGAGDDDSWDGTAGLARSGRIRLVVPCAAAKPATVDGVESHWIRAVPLRPLAPDPAARLPELASLRMRSIVSHEPWRVTAEGSGLRVLDPDGAGLAGAHVTLRSWAPGAGDQQLTLGGDGDAWADLHASAPFAVAISRPTSTGFAAPEPEAFSRRIGGAEGITLSRRRGLLPDKAVGDDRTLDLTKAFLPLGPSPVRGSAFYFACDGVFGRAGARVTMHVSRPLTASEEADARSGEYQSGMQGGQALLANLKTQLTIIVGTLDTLVGANSVLTKPLLDLFDDTAEDWYADVKKKVDDATSALRSVASTHSAILNDTSSAVRKLFPPGNPPPLPDPPGALSDARSAVQHALRLAGDLGIALGWIAGGGDQLRADAQALLDAVAANDATRIAEKQTALLNRFANDVPGLSGFLTGTLPSFLNMTPEAFIADVTARLQAAVTALNGALTALKALLLALTTISLQDFVSSVSKEAAPQLQAPKLAWEWWDGERWRPAGVSGSADAHDFRGSGWLAFDVPAGWEPVEVAGEARRWMRVRLVGGSFSFLRLVSWTDIKTGAVNFLPVVEPRPPALDTLEIFFRAESPVAAPPEAVTLNDFVHAPIAGALAGQGEAVVPFRPMPDRAPALYLGIDGPLPADRVGLYVESAEAAEPDARPPAIVWEGYDGVAWQALDVEDGTRGLTATGVVLLTWPGDASPPGAPFDEARERRVTMAEAHGAARFAAGDRVMLRDARGGESAVVAAASGATVELREPVSRAYVSGEVADAPPARFGRPLTWVRARFDATAEPPSPALAALRLNAVTARQLESVDREIAGSSQGTPRQVLFVRRVPVLEGETVEVRELEGRRAAIELPMLERELAAAGAAGAVTVVEDARTGRPREAWVRWEGRPGLGLSGPGDRHYAIDRAGGRIVFGDGVHGRIPPPAPNGVRVTYAHGGGRAGNVGAGAVSQMLGPVPAAAVVNPAPAAGGSDGETLAGALGRGPALLRHRRVGVSLRDVEDLAREASPAVVRARAMGAVDRHGRSLPGALRVVIVPGGDEARPFPPPELTARVRRMLLARVPATAAARLVVDGPRYTPVGADAIVRVATGAEPGPVRLAVAQRLTRFLHPLAGGPDGDGWPFGAALNLSDVARSLEEMDGVDAVTDVALLLGDAPSGERVVLEPDALPCAGEVRVLLAAGGGC